MGRLAHLGLLWVLSCAASFLLQGCGGGGGPPAPAPSPPPAPPPPPLPTGPLRGIAYSAVPCSPANCSGGHRVGPDHYSDDMMQIGYSAQWGPDGRDDLGSIKTLGGNAVRLYHSMGRESKHDHRAFLDRAWAVGIRVIAGLDCGYCPYPDYDCYDQCKQAVKNGLKVGFMQDGGYHPVVDTIILLNEPDFIPCTGNWCRVKKALSALEGVLDAEKEAGLEPGSVKLTITWSYSSHTSVDGKVTGGGIFGFQDMVAATADPSLAHYTPRTSQAEILKAFNDRWIHGVNTQAPWEYVQKTIQENYAQFLPKQWFIGEYGANGMSQAVIEADLEAMDSLAKTDAGFRGTCIFQFQSSYWKTGPELNYGLFSLGSEKIADTGQVCSDTANGSSCGSWPVYCLDTHLPWFKDHPDMDHRAEAAAKGWGGSAQNKGRCKSSTVTV